MIKSKIIRYWYLAILAILATALLLLKIVIGDNSKTINTRDITPTPSSAILPTTVPFTNQVIPGSIISEEEIIKQLGAPVSITKDTITSGQIYNYQSKYPNWPNQYYYNSDTQQITLFKSYFPKEPLTYYLSELGIPTAVYYTADNPENFPLFSFASQGKAVIANQETGIVLSVWEFKPTTESNFLNTHKDYLSIKPITRF